MENIIKRQLNLERVSFLIISIVIFLLPVFVLPWQNTAFGLGKSYLFYGGILICFFFWLSSSLQKGEITIAKSILFLAGVGLILAWLFSSIFSPNKLFSLIGQGYETDTFAFFLISVVALFLVAQLFNSEKRGLIFYLLILGSGILVFLFQLFHVVFKFDLLPFKIFTNPVSNLIGGWNDLGIFFGFVCLVSLILFELYKTNKLQRILFLISIFLSLLAMAVVNFFTGWIIFGVFAFALFIYIFSRSFQPNNDLTGVQPRGNNILRLSFFVFLIVLSFILASNTIGQLSNAIGINYIEVGPSWQATINVIKETLKTDPITGSGPNTFVYDWLRYKPLAVNSTIFWNLRFSSGVGQIPSMFATGGVITILAILFFLGTVVFYGFKTLSSYYQNELTGAVLMSSFLGSLYLWSFVIFYSPGFVIFSMAFLSTGLLLAMLVNSQKIGVMKISFLSSPRAGFISVLSVAVLVLGTVSAFYLLIQKVQASYLYEKATAPLNTMADVDSAQNYLSRAVNLDSQDYYLRSLAEIDLIKMQQAISDTSLSQDQARTNFQNALASAIQNAQSAVQSNIQEPLNWLELGRVYESIIPLKITGADTMALNSYSEASKYSPFDPSVLLASARVKIQMQNNDDAKKLLESAINIKNDYAPAIFLLSQIEAQAGNIKGAISHTEQTAMLAPNDIGVLFQLGLLYYQDNNFDGARIVLERAVSINSEYANARYFLGLAYDKLGQKNDALEQFTVISKTNPDNEEIKKIIANLTAGKPALDKISPPAPAPEKRSSPPISESGNK